MPRPKSPDAEIIENEITPERIGANKRALAEFGKRSAEVAERFGDGLPYDRERMVTEAKYLMGQSAEAMLEAGKRLVQIKENEPFGEFVEICEGRLGLNIRTAQRMMVAAVKYLSPKLGAKATTLSLLGRGKLFDLLIESDEDLAELAEGGTLAGHTFDEIQSMSVREMRATLTDSRQTLGAKDKVIAKRDQRIAKLEEQIDRPWVPNEQSVAQTAEEAAALDALSDATNAVDIGFTKLGMAVAALQDNPREAVRGRALQAAQYLVARMRDVILENGLEIATGEETFGLRPAFLDYRA